MHPDQANACCMRSVCGGEKLDDVRIRGDVRGDGMVVVVGEGGAHHAVLSAG